MLYILAPMFAMLIIAEILIVFAGIHGPWAFFIGMIFGILGALWSIDRREHL